MAPTVIGHTYGVDPDQWFRLWLALGQGAIGGAVTLGGGYLGYRLAGRADRERRRAEILSDLDEHLGTLERSIISDATNADLSFGHVLALASINWMEAREQIFARSGSPAAVLVAEVSAAVADAAFAVEGDDEFNGEIEILDDLLGGLRRARADCRRWRVDGPPGRRRLRTRWRRATTEWEAIERRQGREAAAAMASHLGGGSTDEERTP